MNNTTSHPNHWTALTQGCCQFCGETTQLCQCVDGHVFCTYHLPKNYAVPTGDDRLNMPTHVCPCCDWDKRSPANVDADFYDLYDTSNRTDLGFWKAGDPMTPATPENTCKQSKIGHHHIKKKSNPEALESEPDEIIYTV